MFIPYFTLQLTNDNYIMNDANLAMYISDILDAYVIMSKRVDDLENEVRILRGSQEVTPKKECKVYDIREVHKLKILHK